MQLPEQPLVTSSFLVRIRNHEPEAWRRLVSIFSPLIYRWCRRSKLSAEEALDVTQDVFRAVHIAVLQFRGTGSGNSFLGWLRTITRNKIRDFFRTAAKSPRAAGGSDARRRLEDFPEAPESPTDSPSEQQEIVVRALSLVRSEFEQKSWMACWKTAVENLPPNEVAQELGMTVGAVYKAKSRILARLRLELDGLVDF